MEAVSTKKITSVEQLIDALNRADEFNGYLHIMKLIDIDEREFEKYYTWNDEYYTRNCISKTDNYELMLICWEKGQRSPIHDFDSNEAWIHPIRGRLIEERFRLPRNGEGLEKVSSVVLGPSEFSYMTEPISIHRYINIFDSRSVSLNLYSKPVTKWKVYNEKTGEYSEEPVFCDSFRQENQS